MRGMQAAGSRQPCLDCATAGGRDSTVRQAAHAAISMYRDALYREQHLPGAPGALSPPHPPPPPPPPPPSHPLFGRATMSTC